MTQIYKKRGISKKGGLDVFSWLRAQQPFEDFE